MGLERSQAWSRNVVWHWHVACSYSRVLHSSLPVPLKKVQPQLSAPFPCFFFLRTPYTDGISN